MATKVYRPRKPNWSEYHDHWSNTPHGSNSPHGAPAAVRHRKPFIDNDASRTKDFVLIRDHGSPEHAYFKRGDRSIHHTWADAQRIPYVYRGQVYHLATIAEAMAFNAKHHVRIRGVERPVGTEVEIKNLHPITPTELDSIMVQLAKDAEAAYGVHWRRYVVVKVLTCLEGGTGYALEVCRAAHAAGIPTMILARNGARFLTFAGHEEVTYVRGSAVIRR